MPRVTQPRRLSDNERLQLYQQYTADPSVSHEVLADVWRIDRSTVSKILKVQLRRHSGAGETSEQQEISEPKFPQVESTLFSELEVFAQDGELITDKYISSHAIMIARSLGISEAQFKGSSGWVDNFKTRWGIKAGQISFTTRINDSDSKNTVANLKEEGSINDGDSESDVGLNDQQDFPSEPCKDSAIPYYHAEMHDNPSIQDAENAIDVLLDFVDQQDDDFVTIPEREVLQNIKYLLFQTSQGLTYVRN